MTEAEWLACDYHHITKMINRAGGAVVSPAYTPIQTASHRKLLLLAIAFCHRITIPLNEPLLRHVIDMAERFTEGACPEAEFKTTAAGVRAMFPGFRESIRLATNRAERSRREAVDFIAYAVGSLGAPPTTAAASAQHWLSLAMKCWAKAHNWAARPTAIKERKAQLDLLRCIVGNPFCPLTFAPSWRSETAVALATGIYAERAFDRLPILADALEEAGCDHADVLTHCRGPGPHARGCWVVDGVLGKS